MKNVLIKDTQEKQKENRYREAAMWRLRDRSDVASSQENKKILTTSRSWKRKGNLLFPSLQRD